MRRQAWLGPSVTPASGADDALHAPRVCTRVRLGDACGCPDQEPDIVQHPSLAIQDHVVSSAAPRLRR